MTGFTSRGSTSNCEVPHAQHRRRLPAVPLRRQGRTKPRAVMPCFSGGVLALVRSPLVRLLVLFESHAGEQRLRRCVLVGTR